MSLPRSWVLKGGVVVDGVSVFDRGLAYGDGLFETMRVHQGRIPLLSLHWRRLEAGLSRLNISLPLPEMLQSFLLDCSASTESGVLKLIVTRGEGGRGYLPPPQAESVQIVSLHSLPVYEHDYGQGIDIGVSRIRLGRNPLLAGLKHLNRLEQVLIRQSLQSAGFLEGVVLDIDDLVIEGAFSNICIVSGNVLLTPILEAAGVAGVMRSWVLENAPALGLPCRECDLRLEDVLAADEVFLCNSVSGLWPVTAIERRRYDAGPWTRTLQKALAAIF